MLTESQIKLLELPFRLDEHSFVQGNIYIKKSAIKKRLDQVDPGWAITPPDFLMESGDVVILKGGITVAGITRYSVGTGIIVKTKKDDATGEIHDLPAFEIARQTAKAYKTAMSDIVARAAMMFSIGDYLKDLPKTKRHEDLKPHLEKLHWAYNGGGKRVAEKIKELNLTWDVVARRVEPGRRLVGLSDTILTEQELIAALVEIAKPAADVQPKTTSVPNS